MGVKKDLRKAVESARLAAGHAQAAAKVTSESLESRVKYLEEQLAAQKRMVDYVLYPVVSNLLPYQITINQHDTGPNVYDSNGVNIRVPGMSVTDVYITVEKDGMEKTYLNGEETSTRYFRKGGSA